MVFPFAVTQARTNWTFWYCELAQTRATGPARPPVWREIGSDQQGPGTASGESIRFGGVDAPLAGVRSHVSSVGFYHGGEPLYTLVDAPGVWHEQRLIAD